MKAKFFLQYVTAEGAARQRARAARKGKASGEKDAAPADGRDPHAGPEALAAAALQAERHPSSPLLSLKQLDYLKQK